MNEAHPFQSYPVYACLPFIELAKETVIQIGPVIFWPASKFKAFIPEHLHSDFQDYQETIGQIKTSINNGNELVNTVKLLPHGTTYLSISQDVPVSQKEELLIDSLYLLYFACSFRNLYYNNEVVSFGAFRKIIPASLDFIQNKINWEHLHIQETDREETVCLHALDPNICLALGNMLSITYEQMKPSDEKISYKRIIRAIRYLVDRFFQRFVNLFNQGLSLPDVIFEPEDVIFLASSFESLFDIDDRQPAADFKHKLRPLLHLKYSTPVEIFWKWIDNFYEARRKIVHGGQTPDLTFRLSPNFEVSHIVIGIKLFIYSTYYILFKHHLVPSQSADPYTPPDFKWIHPEEILLFFWTEKSLLKKIHVYLARLIIDHIQDEEMDSEVHLLTTLFISMQERYYEKKTAPDVVFIPTPLKELELDGQHILYLLESVEHHQELSSKFSKIIPQPFYATLQQRLTVQPV